MRKPYINGIELTTGKVLCVKWVVSKKNPFDLYPLSQGEIEEGDYYCMTSDGERYLSKTEVKILEEERVLIPQEA